MKRLNAITTATLCGSMVLISALIAHGQNPGFYAKGDIGGASSGGIAVSNTGGTV